MKYNWHYSTHIPVLVKALSLTMGDVLELGTGVYSTPILHWLTSPYKRNLFSYDADRKYLDIMGIWGFQDEHHRVQWVEEGNWDSIDIERPWNVALIDHSPGLRRKEDIKRLAPWAKYIIVHDSDGRSEKHYHYSEVWPLFKYMWTWQGVRPHTTVVSNLVDLRGFSI